MTTIRPSSPDMLPPDTLPPDVLLDRLRSYAEDYRLRITNIRKIHQSAPQNGLYCKTCFELMPCPTIRAANGQNE